MSDFDLTKEKIRQSTDLVELIREHVSLKRSGRGWVGLCPFHPDKKSPSFNVNPERGMFKCFGCGVGGDIFKFVQLIEKVEFMDAMRILADRAGIPIEIQSRSNSRPEGSRPADLTKVNEWAAGFFASQLQNEPQGGPGKAFLNGKAISEDMIRDFQLGLALPGNMLLTSATRLGFSVELLKAADLVRMGERGDAYDTFRNRLIFPIRDAMKRVIGFGGRTLDDHRAKYLNSAQNLLFDKSRSLYGIDLARTGFTEKKAAIVVEGYTDCIACHQNGFNNVVATLGTAATESHMQLLHRHCEQVVLLFDSDDAGEKAADRAIGVALQSGLKVNLASVPHGKDPCDFFLNDDHNAFSALLEEATPALKFKWDRTLARFMADGGTDRHTAMIDFVRFLSEYSKLGSLDAIQLGLAINEVARALGAPEEDVRRLLQREQKKVRSHVRSDPDGQPVFEQVVPYNRIDGEQSALVAIMEVVLNAPQLWERAAEVFDPARLSDPTQRRLAEKIFRMANTPDGIQTIRLMSECEDVQETNRLTDMMTHGGLRMNYEATLDAAVKRIRSIADDRATRALSRSLLNHSPNQANKETEIGDEQLKAISERLSQQAGEERFVSRRLVDEIVGTPQILQNDIQD